MGTRRTTAVISGAAAAVLAIATTPALVGAAGAVATSTTSTTTAAVPVPTTAGQFTLPPGYEVLVDDTDRLTVAVPAAWVDVSTAPLTFQGATAPAIAAASDRQLWEDSFDAPGVLYAALPYTADAQGVIDAVGLNSGCDSTTTETYSDGVFTGLWGRWTECGATKQAQWHLIVASPAEQSFTAMVIVQLTGPQDQAAFEVVLETFNVTPSATWPVPQEATPTSTATSTTGVGTTVPVPTPPTTTPATVPATTVSPTPTPGPTTSVISSTATTSTATSSTVGGPSTTAAAPLGGVSLVDETNFLSVTVPADWVDQNLVNSRHDDGSERATITAAPRIDDYYGGWTTPGTHLLALPPTTEPAAILDRFAYPSSCTDGGITPFDNGRFVGQRQTWTDCGGEVTRVVNIAARPADGSFTLFAQVQVTTVDDAVLDLVLGSVAVVQGAIYPAPAALPPLTATGPVPPELAAAPGTALTAITDDDGRLTMSVPATWTDVDGSTQMNDDGSTRSRIAASSDLDSLYGSWETAGAIAVAYPYQADPSVLLRNLGFGASCTDGGVQSFSNGSFTGLMQTWTECGRTDTRNVLLAINPTSQAFTVYLEIQLPDADNTPLQAVLSSLRAG